MKSSPKVLYLNRCLECGDREVWSTFLTRSASDRHRRNHRNIYGKKHGVIVAKYDRASQPSSAEKKT